jgi:ADP-heptose:LPS heptosyltransferase
MKILLSPYSKPLRNGKENPKNYPYWETVVSKLIADGHEVVQIRYGGEKEVPGIKSVVEYTSLKVVEKLLDECDTFLAIDNFLQHLAHFKKKVGVVVWGKSDPTLFGYHENTNLLKDRKYLRNRQFDIWEAEEFDPKVFVEPQIVVESVEKIGLSKS